jgi:hypothetical protein
MEQRIEIVNCICGTPIHYEWQVCPRIDPEKNHGPDLVTYIKEGYGPNGTLHVVDRCPSCARVLHYQWLATVLDQQAQMRHDVSGALRRWRTMLKQNVCPRCQKPVEDFKENGIGLVARPCGHLVSREQRIVVRQKIAS